MVAFEHGEVARKLSVCLAGGGGAEGGLQARERLCGGPGMIQSVVEAGERRGLGVAEAIERAVAGPLAPAILP